MIILLIELAKSCTCLQYILMAMDDEPLKEQVFVFINIIKDSSTFLNLLRFSSFPISTFASVVDQKFSSSVYLRGFNFVMNVWEHDYKLSTAAENDAIKLILNNKNSVDWGFLSILTFMWVFLPVETFRWLLNFMSVKVTFADTIEPFSHHMYHSQCWQCLLI